ncbi:MAG: hypothetical protein HY831_02470 [Candidatus Aenigmarchaeota archaeon]|nr:hypothetical protein [Candidatus Aenigmarchaeota archaeon]
MLFIIIFSVLVLIVINVFYRILINQDEVLDIKDRMKHLEEESKKYKNEPEKTKEYFGKIMDENRKLTKLSLKPMLVSFAIIMVMLPIMSIFYTDLSAPLDSNNMGNVTIGSFYLVKLDNNTVQLLQNDTQILNCSMPCMQHIDDKVFNIHKETVDNNGEKQEHVRFSRIVIETPVAIPFIGKDLGWIWLYIMLSIPLTIVVKKLMGVKI